MGFKHSSREFVQTVKGEPIILGIWASILAIAAIGLVASIAEASTTHPTDARCFKASDWGPAPDSIRPCVVLKGNAPEAGAVRFAVKDGSGVVRYAGYVNTSFHRIVRVRVVRIYEDGSFTWKARSRDGRTVTASVGNLED